MDTSFKWSRFINFLTQRWDEILNLALQHLAVVAISLAIALVVGILIGSLVWSRPIGRATALTAAGVAITIPSLAVLALLSPVMGLGWGPSIVALVFYGLLPIIRNTVVGLREVPSQIVEAARGMGMGRLRILATTQLPIAWPVIMTGVRVSAQMLVGIAAIAAYVAGPGLGQYIFTGLSSMGSFNSINYALTGTGATIVLALLIDAAFIFIARSTTSKGLRV